MDPLSPLRKLGHVGIGLSLAACSAGAMYGPHGTVASGALPSVRGTSGSPSPIKHVVVIIQENRSFDNIFAGYPGADAPMVGYGPNRVQIPLQQTTFSSTINLEHTLQNGLKDYDNGKMDGFVYANVMHKYPNAAYVYLERESVAPYWTLARQYVLADRMFPTEWGASFTAHLDLIAGTTLLNPTLAEADLPSALPWSCDAPPGTVTTTWTSTKVYDQDGGPFPCFTQFETMADTLDAAHVTWKYYAPAVGNSGNEEWSSFAAISAVRYGPDWKNVVTPETTVLTDAEAGNLPAVSWVIPDLKNSDHPGNGSDTGPSWVASVVNAIGESEDWKSTAIVIVWDDWGGFYDNVRPPQLDFLGLSIRVPCLIVSPYAKKGYVSHTRYEFGSILKFIEQTFGLQSLGATDVRANSIGDSFEFASTPRRFRPISAPYPTAHFIREKPSLLPPDDE